jgi:hypothetical protein
MGRRQVIASRIGAHRRTASGKARPRGLRSGPTGIAHYLGNNGTIENAQAIAGRTDRNLNDVSRPIASQPEITQ